MHHFKYKHDKLHVFLHALHLSIFFKLFLADEIFLLDIIMIMHIRQAGYCLCRFTEQENNSNQHFCSSQSAPIFGEEDKKIINYK